jgi:hypothetical protein
MCNQQRGLAPIARGSTPKPPGNSHDTGIVMHVSIGSAALLLKFTFLVNVGSLAFVQFLAHSNC